MIVEMEAIVSVLISSMRFVEHLRGLMQATAITGAEKGYLPSMIAEIQSDSYSFVQHLYSSRLAAGYRVHE